MPYTMLIRVAVIACAAAHARLATAQPAVPSRPPPRLHVAVLADRPSDAAAASTAMIAGAPPAAPPRPRSVLVPLVLGGVALALGADAVIAEWSARSTYDRSKREADDERQAVLWHAANSQRYVGEGLGIASLACAGLAVWRYVHDDRAAPEPGSRTSRWQLAPIVGPTRAVLALEGRY